MHSRIMHSRIMHSRIMHSRIMHSRSGTARREHPRDRSVAPMLISGRQAGRILRDVLSSDEQARLLLRTGIAGRGTETGRGLLFDEPAVHEVRLRPTVDRHELRRVCPHGIFVARLPRTAELDLTRPWTGVSEQVRQIVSAQRPPTTMTAALIGAQIRAWGPLPFAATFFGYVVLTADLLLLAGSELRLARPSRWAGAVEGRLLHTPAGGRPGYLWEPPLRRDR
jgi:hypothetical protein